MIISRYLIKEVSNALLAASFVMLLIFLSNQLIRYLKYAAMGKIAPAVVLQLMGLEIPYLLVLLLPLGMYLGIIVGYGRLYAENEMRVMQAGGLSTQQLIKITGILGVFIGLLVLALALWVNPYLAGEKSKLLKKNIAAENVLDTLIPGRFQVSGDDKRVVYVENIARNRQQAQNLFIAEQGKSQQEGDSRVWNVLSAAEGYQARDPKTQDRYVVATDGFRYEGAPGQNEYKIIQFKKYAVRLIEHAMITQQEEVLQPTTTLWNQYQDPKKAAELQWRISMPISALVLAMLAIPLSYVRPRQSRYARLFPAILIYIIYINLLFVARDWIEDKVLSVSLGMWWVHICMLSLVFVLYVMQSHKNPFRWFLNKKLFVFKARVRA